MKYPAPEQNPRCQCHGDTGRAFWCRYGHVLECHYPYSCREAGCDHLDRLNLPPDELTRLKGEARLALSRGQRRPYYLDEQGNICLADEKMK